VRDQGVTALDTSFGRQDARFLRRGGIVGNHLEALVHEDRKRPLELEEQFNILEFE
jgi:hypothetical protein